MVKIKKRGGNILSSIVNKAVDLLPFEAHLPGYSYCGPGTHLKKRLARGDPPINPLDEACKLHDIAYSKYRDPSRRSLADKELADRAWRRFKASDSSLGEKAAAWAVTTTMKAKSKLGTGKSKKRKVIKNLRDALSRLQVGRGFYLRPYPKRGNGKVQKKKSQKRSKK